MSKRAIRKTIKKYVKTTSLHGFKYLYSPFIVDRIGWLLSIIASAGCAGVLCTVLWARFSEVPALLTRLENSNSHMYMEEKLPSFIVCPTTESVANIFLDHLSANETEMLGIPTILERLLSGKLVNTSQLSLLEDLLAKNNVTLGDVMVKHAPGCDEHLKRCRVQGVIVPCEQFFHSQLTTLGVCCVSNSKKLENFPRHTIPTLDLVMQFTHGSRTYGCQLIAKYEGEDLIEPDILTPETYYMAQQSFRVIIENPSVANLMKSSCMSHKEYSWTLCMFTCAEISCGCRDPLHPPNDFDETLYLPICPLTRMECVRGSKNRINLTCNCPPPCREITTSMVLHSSKLDVEHILEPFFKGLNSTATIVVQFRVDVIQSRVIMVNPTDTFVTLLSSLGGVFNMFLGIGLFSALEFLFFMLVKLPAAMKKPSKVPAAQAPQDYFVYRQQHHHHRVKIGHFSLRGRQKQ